MALGSDLRAHRMLEALRVVASPHSQSHELLDLAIDILFSEGCKQHHKERWRKLSQEDQDAMETRVVLLARTIRDDKGYRPDHRKMRRLVLGRE